MHHRVTTIGVGLDHCFGTTLDDTKSNDASFELGLFTTVVDDISRGVGERSSKNSGARRDELSVILNLGGLIAFGTPLVLPL